MSSHILDDLTPEAARKRSALLTTLCILTWVGSGLLALYQVYQFYILRDILLRTDIDLSDGILQYYYISTITSAVLALMRILAAVQMWQLRKIGFYLYLTSCCADVLLTLFFNARLIGIANFFSLMGLVIFIPIAFSALFIGLYYLSFKQMK